MLATAEEARVHVCLMSMVVPLENSCELCRANDCSAWRWLPGKAGAGAGERIGYCALIGRIEIPCRRTRNKGGRPAIRVS